SGPAPSERRVRSASCGHRGELMRRPDRNDLLAQRHQRYRNEFEVGQRQRNTDDRDRHRRRADEMTDRQPYSEKHYPEDISDKSPAPGRWFVDDRASERPQRV